MRTTCPKFEVLRALLQRGHAPVDVPDHVRFDHRAGGQASSRCEPRGVHGRVPGETPPSQFVALFWKHFFCAGFFSEGSTFTSSEAFAEILSELVNVRRHYAAWNFFHSLYDEPECDEGFSPIRAREFIDNYHDHYGNETLVTDPMESAYVGVPFFFPSGSGSGPRCPRRYRTEFPCPAGLARSLCDAMEPAARDTLVESRGAGSWDI